MLSLFVLLWRHGTARRRREATWVGIGVILFDWFGLTLLAVLLPRLGLPTAAWSPASLAAGSMVMLSGMVLTRQRELEHRERELREQSDRELTAPARRRHTPAPVTGTPDPACRACASCGAVLSRHVEMAHCPLDGGVIVSGADPWPGRTIDGGIVVEELLGAGGMGRVYRARRDGTRVALKLLNGELAAAPPTAERFSREARSTMRIRSPHVVTVHDLGMVPPGIPYLTMELISGPTLQALLMQGGRLTLPSVALLGRQLAMGLVAAHGESIIHRDLKPDNVLICKTPDGDCAKIVDFGLAKIIDDPLVTAELTTVGRVFGTPAYLSPEQGAGLPLTARCDIYSLGVLLYRARAGRKPFEGSAMELIASHISELPPPLGTSPLDALIMSLLEKDAGQRPDAHELVARFDALSERVTRFEVAAGPHDPSLAIARTEPLPGVREPAPRRRARITPLLSPASSQSPTAASPPPSSEAAPPAQRTVPTRTPGLRSPPPLRGVRYADENLALARSGNINISVLRRPLTLDGIAQMRRESRHMFGDAPDRYAALAVIEPGAANAVSPEVREASAEFAREFKIRGAAIVIEGTGFRPAATRTLIAGLYLMTKKAYPHKIFENLDDAAAWLVPLLASTGVKHSVADIVSAAEQARLAIRPVGEVMQS
jgi:serine/threonine protein kinase